MGCVLGGVSAVGCLVGSALVTPKGWLSVGLSWLGGFSDF